jgi:phosphatidylglycerophosphatase A
MPAERRWPPAAIWLATWGGCGYAPKAPGTAGSLGGLAVAWILTEAAAWPPVTLAAAALVLLLPAVWSASRAVEYWAGDDPQPVVIDEVLGQWLTLAATPARDWRWWLAAFLLFRLFDIWKPFPARAAERLPRGWGVVADDVVAGLYGAVVLAAFRALNL